MRLPCHGKARWGRTSVDYSARVQTWQIRERITTDCRVGGVGGMDLGAFGGGRVRLMKRPPLPAGNATVTLAGANPQPGPSVRPACYPR
jgi:hypothetical protein